MTHPAGLDESLTSALAGLPRSPLALGVPPHEPPAGSDDEPAPTAGGPETVGAESGPPSGEGGVRPTVGGMKQRVRQQAVRGVNKVARRLGQAGAGRELVQPIVSERIDPLASRLEELTERVASLSAELARMTADRGQITADRINLGLLKNDVIALSGRVDEVLAEVRTNEGRLLDLGIAFAPGSGLAGAGARFAELREQINSVERRLRFGPAAAALDAPAGAPTAGAPAAAGPAAEAAAAGPAGVGEAAPSTTVPAEAASSAGSSVASELFNYVAFERRFRGDPETIIALQTERYGDVLAAHTPVVDVGCGRGELLEHLQQRGVEVIGVDTDSGMVAEGRARGLDIRHTDVIAFLEEAQPGSIGSIFSAHLAEHLDLDVLIRFLELSAAKLRPGGVFIAETPNPASLIVLGNSYILDPTHVRPLHPSLLAFLCETAGFRDVRLQFFSPATGYHLGLVDDADAPDWIRTINSNAERLNEVLFGPQEYAVVASTPS